MDDALFVELCDRMRICEGPKFISSDQRCWREGPHLWPHKQGWAVGWYVRGVRHKLRAFDQRSDALEYLLLKVAGEKNRGRTLAQARQDIEHGVFDNLEADCKQMSVRMYLDTRALNCTATWYPGWDPQTHAFTNPWLEIRDEDDQVDLRADKQSLRSAQLPVNCFAPEVCAFELLKCVRLQASEQGLLIGVVGSHMLAKPSWLSTSDGYPMAQILSRAANLGGPQADTKAVGDHLHVPLFNPLPFDLVASVEQQQEVSTIYQREQLEHMAARDRLSQLEETTTNRRGWIKRGVMLVLAVVVGWPLLTFITVIVASYFDLPDNVAGPVWALALVAYLGVVAQAARKLIRPR